MTFDELLEKASGSSRTPHVFGPPIEPAMLDAWLGRWPAYKLPEDMKQLLLRANGIHLFADLETGRAYAGMAPLQEWEPARIKMWGAGASIDLLGDDYLAISYNMDHSDYWVLKISTGEYFWMDSCGADETSRIGGSVAELLDWMWAHCAP